MPPDFHCCLGFFNDVPGFLPTPFDFKTA